MAFRDLKRALALGLISLTAAVGTHAWAEGELTRKVKVRIQPEYPQLARRMNITGVVRVQITVAPNGTIKTTKVVGGHPILVNAVMDVVKRWRFEPASEDTTGILEFRFDPNE